MTKNSLPQVLADVRRRLLGVSIAAGTAWGLAAGVLLLVVCAWIDLALDLPPGLRVVCSLVALGSGVALMGWGAFSALRQSTSAALARRLDKVAGGSGQILAGVDLFGQYNLAGATGASAASSGGLSGALAGIAIARASSLASDVMPSRAVPVKPLYWPGVSLLMIGIGLGIVGLAAPRLSATQWQRFMDPYGDHPPYSSIDFDVQPGNTRVLYGAALDVRVTISGGVVERLDLVLLSAESTSMSDATETLPMFPEPGGTWRASVANVTTAGRYFVRTRGARSRQYGYDLITVPELKDVKFRITPPAYTRRPPYEGALPQGGLAGLPGTKVELWAKSNRPLSVGSLKFTADNDAPAASTTQPSATAAASVPNPTPPSPSTIALAPVAAGASEVTGSFTIIRAGKIELKIADVAGQESRDAFTASVNVLHDDRPFVRILEPMASSFATPDVALSVSLLAEDDYGVSRLQLFRSLNDSRPLPIECTVPPAQPTRLSTSVTLKLSEYGLNPGDVIRLFARVEDNDPAGAKGSESSVVTVQIISREDMNRMTLAREGMEVLLSKYESARRRLEAIDNEAQKLQKELAKLDPNSAPAKEIQKRMEELAEQVSDAADEIEKNAAEDLPFDIDHKLRDQLADMAKQAREAGKAFSSKSKTPGLSAAGMDKAVSELRKKLGAKRDEFEQEATEPLEHLAKIFPLKEDEARFLDIYQRQRDLADRMAALKALEGDDPKSKVRMRDLEGEQAQLRRDLLDLLDDVDNHIQALPADPKLDDLRESARAFAEGVRASAAAEQMQASEMALADFDGATSAGKSKDAADTLEKFISKCNGMGDQAGACLKFQPKLAQGLGNSVEQLLEAEGLLPNQGKNGFGAGGGYSSRRSTLNNVGLYGSMPRMSQKAGSHGGQAHQGAAASFNGGPGDPADPSNAAGGGQLKAAGESGANVPAQYRKKVGEYFQRVADELGE